MHLTVGGDDGMTQTQLKVFASMLKKLRAALDSNDLKEKTISYTSRYNSLYDDDNTPGGF